MMKLWLTFVCIGGFLIFEDSQNLAHWNGNTSVQTVLQELGDPKPQHYLIPSAEQIKKGEELVKLGRTTNAAGKKTPYISKHYMCTTCHNLEQEDPDLRISDPEARLAYVKEKGIPFLQGTTFRGIVNRESWYNDDYVKKYGDEKIEIAHKNLRESIQLCAVECSQGREMEAWEIDAVLAYYWSLQFTLDDLDLTVADFEKLNAGKAVDKVAKDSLRIWLKTFYNQTSPAHFYDAPADKKVGYKGLIGDPARGKDIYELSCLHCHQSGGVSHYILDDTALSFKHLDKMVPKNSHFSLYQIIAYGTYSIPGHRPYMPHYPEERMSKQQVEDLRAYVEMRASKSGNVSVSKK